jgi:2-polyprenyl-6-methoxyphenol hydroxylase-like FAD-dependent oxidoreductase
VRVERGVTFEGFVRRDRAIACRISGGGGHDLRVEHLLGCDGAHSTVRTAAGIAFEGSAYDHDWTLADVEMDWPFQADEAVFLFTRRGALFAIPVTRGVWRIVRNGPDPQGLLPPDVHISRVLWTSAFRISHRLAERFAADGVFLAGDAAHVHSPAGARGMNGGVEDAATFAWLVESGREARYDALRRPVARRVLRQVDRQTRQATSGTGFAVSLREAVSRVLLPLGPVQRVAARFITALDQPAPAWLREQR